MGEGNRKGPRRGRGGGSEGSGADGYREGQEGGRGAAPGHEPALYTGLPLAAHSGM